MERTDGLEVAAGPWEVFALGALAPLGPFPQVHLAPKIPPGLLNTAVVSYLPLHFDELLLALIDGGAGKLEGCCALTTRRIYWVTTDEAESPARSVHARWAGRARGRGLRSQAVDYASLPQTITESPGPDGSVELDLRGGRPLVLKSADPRLARELARYLQTMGTMARTGVAPSLSAGDPELAQRVARAWPAVAQVTNRARNLGRDLMQFRRALDTATPRAFVTPVLIAVCVLVYVAMVCSGVSPLWPNGAQLVGWGANEGARIILRHEYWRLLTSAFVHGGLIHVALNMWSLLVIGPLVERLYGNAAYAVIYLAAGIGGAIASVAASPVRVSVGASGAICGVLGALLAFLLTHRRTIPLLVLKPLRANALGYVIFIAILGAVVPNIDQEAHLGGLAAGFVCGLLLTRPWPVVAGKWVAVRRLCVSAMIAAALAGAAVAVARRGAMRLPPAMRFQHFEEQIARGLTEFNAIRDDIPSSLALRRDQGDPATRRTHVDNIEKLTKRATINLTRLRRVTTPDAGLRIMVASLIEAQTSQLARLRAARGYLETGDSEKLTGPTGFLAERTATDRDIRAFQQQQYNYLSEHKLIPQRPPPEQDRSTDGKNEPG